MFFYRSFNRIKNFPPRSLLFVSLKRCDVAFRNLLENNHPHPELQERDLNPRPLGYEPSKLPNC